METREVGVGCDLLPRYLRISYCSNSNSPLTQENTFTVLLIPRIAFFLSKVFLQREMVAAERSGWFLWSGETVEA